MKLHERKGPRLLSLVIALIFALTVHPNKGQAQITAAQGLEADIPFQFYAGNAKLPPGKYFIRVLDDTDLNVMEISSADGRTTALFDVEAVQAKSTPKGELIFNKYGNRYFLEQLFDDGVRSGSQVVESRYEQRVDKGTVEAEEHVPAHHRTS